MTHTQAGGLDNTQQQSFQSGQGFDPTPQALFEDALGSQLSRVSTALETIFARAESVDPGLDSYGHAQNAHYDNAVRLMKAAAKLAHAAAELRGRKLEKSVTIRNEHVGFIPKSLAAVPSDKPVIEASPAALEPEPEPEPVSVWQMELPPHNEFGGVIKIGPSIRSQPGEPLDIEWAEPGDVYDPKMQLSTGEVYVDGKGWVQPPRKNFQNSEGSNGNFG
jgi:hypothetical protein